jgi:hypothetical protein
MLGNKETQRYDTLIVTQLALNTSQTLKTVYVARSALRPQIGGLAQLFFAR